MSTDVKRPGRDVDLSLPTSAEVKNEWSYTSSPPVCPSGEDLPFTFCQKYEYVTDRTPSRESLPLIFNKDTCVCYTCRELT